MPSYRHLRRKPLHSGRSWNRATSGAEPETAIEIEIEKEIGVHVIIYIY